MIILLLISACGLKRKEDKTPSPFTPTARYEYTVLMGVALITTEAVGNIPPRTPVRVQGMRYDGSRGAEADLALFQRGGICVCHVVR